MKLFVLAILALSISGQAVTASAWSPNQFKGLRRALLQGQTTAIASATAVSTGGTAITTSTADAESSGSEDATAVSVGVSVAEAGETVITDCNVYAKDSEQYKVCIGTPVEDKDNTTADATAAAQGGVVSWDSAPTCKGNSSDPSMNPRVDSFGRVWGYEDNSSCAFRDSNGTAVYYGGSSGSAAIAFVAAPPCTDVSNCTVKDTNGRLWGYEDGGSCACKDEDGSPITSIANATATATASANATAGH